MTDPLTKTRVQDAQQLVNETYDLLAYLTTDDCGQERVLAECARRMLNDAGDLLDGNFPEGGAS